MGSWERQRAEEIANTATHALAIVASVIGAVLLVALSWRSGDPWRIVSGLVFGLALITLYTASTLYHGITNPRSKARLKIFDHIAIYVLIAGSYTPYMLVGLRGSWGWSIFGVIWGLALLGIVFKLFFTGRFKGVSLATYLAMGWLIVIAAGPMVRSLPMNVLLWLAIGGLCYTAGSMFYISRRLPFSHSVWHVFVMLGSASHFISIWLHFFQ